MLKSRKPMKRTRLLRKSRIRPVRRKPRPGRLKGDALKMLRVDCYARPAAMRLL